MSNTTAPILSAHTARHCLQKPLHSTKPQENSQTRQQDASHFWPLLSHGWFWYQRSHLHLPSTSHILDRPVQLRRQVTTPQDPLQFVYRPKVRNAIICLLLRGHSHLDSPVRIMFFCFTTSTFNTTLLGEKLQKKSLLDCKLSGCHGLIYNR